MKHLKCSILKHCQQTCIETHYSYTIHSNIGWQWRNFVPYLCIQFYSLPHKPFHSPLSSSITPSLFHSMQAKNFLTNPSHFFFCFSTDSDWLGGLLPILYLILKAKGHKGHLHHSKIHRWYTTNKQEWQTTNILQETVSTSEHISFYFFILYCFYFQFFLPCGRLSWLMSTFERTLIILYSIVNVC